MSRRYPGAGSRSGAHPATGLARHRWAASLGGASGEGLLGGTPTETLLDQGSQNEGAAADFPAAKFRWRTGRRTVVLIAVVSVLLCGWFWWQAADAAPRVQPLGAPPGSEAADGSGPAIADETDPGRSAAADPAATDLAGTTAAGIVIVHVAGAVAKPGVVELPRGSRLHEAIKAAGGSSRAADLDRLNLAAVLEDGQKILVPERGSPDPVEPASPSATSGGAGTAGGTGPAGGKINLNTAGVEQLATLPRVGPVLAQRIVDWRAQHGSFGRVEELDAVDGIGPKLLEGLLPLVRV